MTPRIYDPENPILWRDIPFEELLKLVEGRLNFHAYHHEHKIPGYDKDDIRQELVFALWNKLDKFPADLDVFDYRFLRYVDMVFFREITNIWRGKTFKDRTDLEEDPKKPGVKRPKRKFRDELNRSLPMVENFDEFHDE